MLLLTTTNRLDSIVQLLSAFLIFIFVLILAVFTTRFTAGLQRNQLSSPNVEVLETFKITQSKFIQVVRIGTKYFAYIVCKDTVTLLGEMTKEDILEFKNKKKDSAIDMSFKEIFDKLKKK